MSGSADGHEQAHARRGSAADPTSELVQLRHAKPLGVHDHHHGGVRDVDADLHDRRRDQDIDLAGGEALHDVVLLLRRHPAVQRLDPESGERTLLQLREQARARTRRPIGWLAAVIFLRRSSASSSSIGSTGASWSVPVASSTLICGQTTNA